MGLYLSKCQKDMIWRRLFIIFKDIELNHWNQNIKNLCKEVVVYYERIDSVYWQALRDEYEQNSELYKDNMDKPKMNGQTRGRSNGQDLNNGSKDDSRSRSNDITTPPSEGRQVVVPSTLVPAKYQEEREYELMNRKRARKSRYESLRDTAEQKRKDLPYATLQAQKDMEADKQSNKPSNQHIDSDLPPVDQVEQFGFEVMKSVEDLNANGDDEKDIDSSDKVGTGGDAEEITSNDSPESVG